jgi:hypothetical protein
MPGQRIGSESLFVFFMEVGRMAVDDLPGPVVNFLNIIGVPWPYIDEDVVIEFATLVRNFGQAVQTTHEDATAAVAGIAQAHQGASTEQMHSGWKQLSAEHVDEIVAGCGILAGALDVAAGYIVAQKAVAIATLVEMAIAFIEAQAAAVETLGASEAAVPVIIEGGKLLMKALIQDIEQHVIGEVIEAAAKPLFAKIEHAMEGLDWSKSGGAGGASEGFVMDAEAVRRHTDALRTHAETMQTHGSTFEREARGLRF